MKRITGTFLDEVTWDIPSQNWGKEEWRREFDTFKEAGIDTVIIIRAGLRDVCIFPSEALGVKGEPDLAQLFLDEAQRCGMKLFFGSYDPGNLAWEWANWKDSWPVCSKFIEEVYKRYGQHPAFQGWYIAPETCVATPGSIAVFKNTSEKMKSVADLPVLISPYYPSYVYKDQTKEVRHQKFVEDWHKIFSEAKAIDIAAFQDGSCSFHQEEFATLELEDYIQEVHQVCKEHHVTMWNNVESFGRGFPIKFPPIDWRLLKKKMEIADPYAEKQITFEFSHFMSPNSMYPSARMLYKRYIEDILGG
jgi:endo-1,4-beta-mannosidase